MNAEELLDFRLKIKTQHEKRKVIRTYTCRGSGADESRLNKHSIHSFMEPHKFRSRRLQVLNGQIDYAWMEKVAEDSSSRTPGLGRKWKGSGK